LRPANPPGRNSAQERKGKKKVGLLRSETVVGELVRADDYLEHLGAGQLGLLDRWLAEAVLSLTFIGGDEKKLFSAISLAEPLRHGLPLFPKALPIRDKRQLVFR
jgi:hypothetical protein